MISAEKFWSVLKSHELSFFSGVPCSILKPVLNWALGDSTIEYLSAVREDAALGLATGAYLAGRRSGIMIQNSGLGNIIEPLTSLNLVYKIPVLLIITWRGYGEDAPQHLVMGRCMEGFLSEMGIPYQVIAEEEFADQVDWATSVMDSQHIPAALILKRGVVS